jgi:hydrogenase maturation protein HypF
LASPDAEEERLLASVERPIVLVRRRPSAALAGGVAPDLDLVGLLLPYSPLHHLLLAETGPLVMTSGNLCEEPIAYRNRDAVERLGTIADLFLVHDRAIASRCDDSVALVVADGPLLIRRSRGWVPRPIALQRPLAQPILACGAHLKNTFCLGVGDSAYLGPHLGDLDNLETYEALADAVGHMERLLRVEPEIIAHDLHPEYLSTVYARRRHGKHVAVQHHHAHVASAMAEHRLDGPVLGIAFDGTGLGTDGSAWGGEILWAEGGDFTRLATLRPIHLAGGDVAVRQVWRLALAVLDDACDTHSDLDGLELFGEIPENHVRVVRQMLAGGLHTPAAHGAGRWFDAVGALLLGQASSSYEGQVALRLQLLADPRERRCSSWTLHSSDAPWEIDLRPAIRDLLDAHRRGVPAAKLAARFHNTLAAATAGAVRALAERHERLPVVLTGGCFQNRLLTERLLAKLADFEVHVHREVPPGDGGIALGQLLVAARTANGEEDRPCV